MDKSKKITKKDFNFGENWREFSKTLNVQKYSQAKQSLYELAGEMHDKSFLDAGCGSGLFSIAALSLGAKRVVGFDYNKECVALSRENFNLLAQVDMLLNPQKIDFFTGSVLEIDEAFELFDVVYSWGVLHHTGNMYLAFDKVSSLVKNEGFLIISIYNRHFTSAAWKLIKKIYNISPKVIKKIMACIFYPIVFLAKIIVTGKNPLRKKRGMSFYYDLIDWIGGYPYEYASVKEVCDYFNKKGFEVNKVIPAGVPTGCNEFIFKKAR